MPTEQEKCAATYECLRAHQAPKEIIKFLGYPKPTVYRIKKQFDAEAAANAGVVKGDGKPLPHRKAHNRRKDAQNKKDPEFVKKLQNKINKHPGKPIRALAADMGVYQSCIRKYLKSYIRYKSYKMRRGQFMSAKTKARSSSTS